MSERVAYLTIRKPLVFVLTSETQRNSRKHNPAKALHESIPGHSTAQLPRRNSDTCMPVFITALFTIGKHTLMNEWINKMWCIYATEYYSTIKRDEVLIHAITWMNLKNIMLSISLEAPMVKSPPANAGYAGLILGPEGSHVPQNN